MTSDPAAVAQAQPRKPMATARRVSLFEREIRVGLSSAAVEILFDLASILSEGAHEAGGFFGSTMVTIDLARATTLVSDACDAATVKRVAELIAADPRVRERARGIAAAEADRMAGARLRTPQIDVRARASGRHLHLDIDVSDHSPEAPR